MKSSPISWSGKPSNITLRPEESRPNGPVPLVTAGRPETPSTPAGVRLDILGITGNCVDYGFAVAGPVTRVDLKLVAGREGALVDVRRD